MSYEAMANDRRKTRNLSWPAGDYVMLLKGHTFGPGKNPPYNKKVTIEMSCISGPAGEEAVINKLQELNRTLKNHFVFSERGFGFSELLVFLQDLGADLSACRPQNEDPDFQDLRTILKAAERTPPEIKLTVSWKENAQFPDIRIKEVQKIFSATKAPAAPAAPAPIAAPAAAPAPAAPAAAPAEVVHYMDGENVASGSRVEVQSHIDGGYMGQVCVDGENWIDATAAGFTIGTPAPVTPPAAAPAPAGPAVTPPAADSAPAAPAAAGAPVDPFTGQPVA